MSTFKQLELLKIKLYSNTGFFALAILFIIIVLFSLNKGKMAQENNFLQEKVGLGGGELISNNNYSNFTDVLESSEPTKIKIPKLNLEADFGETLGVDDFGAIEVPEDFDKVGWYKHGPTPGELGPAVILGHVDSLAGPAIFFSLGQLKAGDEIYVEREDGSVAKFEVEKLERVQQNNFPTEKVYGDIDYAGLRLITCSGIYVRGARQYTHNLIVYARLVDF